MHQSQTPNTMPIDELNKLLQYNSETGNFHWRVRRGSAQAGSLAGSLGIEGYRRIRIMGRFYRASRVAWAMFYGEWPNTESEIDHINGCGADNRIANLREADHTHNAANNGGWKTRGNRLKGAYPHRNRWRAIVSKPGGRSGEIIHIGSFATEEEAHDCYVEWAKSRYGEFANPGTGSPHTKRPDIEQMPKDA
jgi:hypothetical protein